MSPHPSHPEHNRRLPATGQVCRLILSFLSFFGPICSPSNKQDRLFSKPPKAKAIASHLPLLTSNFSLPPLIVHPQVKFIIRVETVEGTPALEGLSLEPTAEETEA